MLPILVAGAILWRQGSECGPERTPGETGGERERGESTLGTGSVSPRGRKSRKDALCARTELEGNSVDQVGWARLRASADRTKSLMLSQKRKH